MFLWERFGSLAPTPVEYSAMTPNRTRVVSPARKSIYKAACLADMKQSTDKSLATFIDKEDNCNFRSYTFAPTGIHQSRSSRR